LTKRTEAKTTASPTLEPNIFQRSQRIQYKPILLFYLAKALTVPTGAPAALLSLF
jgi:hypothetical protein